MIFKVKYGNVIIAINGIYMIVYNGIRLPKPVHVHEYESPPYILKSLKFDNFSKNSCMTNNGQFVAMVFM